MMTRKVNVTEWIDSYLNNQMDPEEKKEFEAEMTANPQLLKEVNLHREIEDALKETDINRLKETLNAMADSETTTPRDTEPTFDLLEYYETFHDFNNLIDPRELLNYYESLPKLHVYQHEIVSREKVHPFYREQKPVAYPVEEEEESADEALMAEIEEALGEKDISHLRDNLKQIARTMPDHAYSIQQVDAYIHHLLPEEERVAFEKEMAVNKRLVADVKMHRELEEALKESEIKNLRDRITSVMETEASYGPHFNEIEQYLDKELAEKQRVNFENELYENPDLKADVSLHKEVDLAAAETDIMQLRNELRELHATMSVREEKSVIRLDSRMKSALVRYTAAVVVLIAFGLSLFFRFQPVNNKALYAKYSLQTEATTVSRSIEENDRYLRLGNELFNTRHYEEAALLFQIVIDRDDSNAIPQFFLANSFQHMKKYPEAIEGYEKVVAHKGNTYKQLAEFNIGLCYLVQNDKKRAVSQFQRILRNGNFYAPEAKAILRELKPEDLE
jgi:tetratricopeptide (TPR) repeat protein